MKATGALLHVVGNEARRRILALLSREPHYVSQLAKRLDLTQPAVLRHLRVLEESGLVESFTERNPRGGPRKYYRICRSLELEIALHPSDFKVTERSRRGVCPRHAAEMAVIDRLTDEINQAKDLDSKARVAAEMVRSADGLLSCGDHDGGDAGCVSCHRAADLKKKVAQTILHLSEGDLSSGLRALTEALNQISGLLSGAG